MQNRFYYLDGKQVKDRPNAVFIGLVNGVKKNNKNKFKKYIEEHYESKTISD
jgi:hypothetical protein